MSSSSGELRSASSVRQDSQIAPATASFGQFWAGFGALMFVIEGYFSRQVDHRAQLETG